MAIPKASLLLDEQHIKPHHTYAWSVVELKPCTFGQGLRKYTWQVNVDIEMLQCFRWFTDFYEL